jgi:hypothetical protein
LKLTQTLPQCDNERLFLINMNNIQDAIDFLRLNHVLDDWDNHQIATGMKVAIDTCCACWSSDRYGNIDGLVFGRWIVPGEHIFVIAAAGKGKLKTFFNYLRQTFPDCHKISALRYGVERIYTI